MVENCLDVIATSHNVGRLLFKVGIITPAGGGLVGWLLVVVVLFARAGAGHYRDLFRLLHAVGNAKKHLSSAIIQGTLQCPSVWL